MFSTISEWQQWWKSIHPESAISTFASDQFLLIRADINNQLFVWDESVQGPAPQNAPVDRRLDVDAVHFLGPATVSIYPLSPAVDEPPAPTTPFATPPASYAAIRAIARRAAQAAQAAAAAALAAAGQGQVQPTNPGSPVTPTPNPGFIPNLPGGIFTTPIPVTPPVIQNPYVPVPTVPAPVIDPGTPIVPIPTTPGSGDTFSPNPGATPPGETSTVLRDLGSFALLTSPAWLALLWIERKKLRRVFG